MLTFSADHRFSGAVSKCHSFLPVLRFQRPQDAHAFAAVELFVVPRHRRHVHDAVVVPGRHVDALVFVAHERDRPELRARLLVQRERRRRGRSEHPSPRDDQAVRALVGRFVGFRPDHLAGLQVDRLHVGGQILGEHRPAGDDRRGRVAPVLAFRRQRQRPRGLQLGDRGAVDRTPGVARVGRVAVRISRAGEQRAFVRGRTSSAPPPAMTATTSTTRRPPPAKRGFRDLRDSVHQIRPPAPLGGAGRFLGLRAAGFGAAHLARA